jgi:hypothetical protein
MASHAEKELQEFDVDAEGGNPGYNFLWLQYNPLPLYEPFNFTFLGAFAKKLRKETISFLISVRPSVRMEQFGSHWTDFHEI